MNSRNPERTEWLKGFREWQARQRAAKEPTEEPELTDIEREYALKLPGWKPRPKA